MASSNSAALILPADRAATNAVMEDIRPLKPPVHIPSTYGWLGWVLAAAIAAAAAWWTWKKFRKKQALAPTRISIPPHRKAKDRLRTASELYSDPYRFCSLVSDVVREYLEERFSLHAPDRTTEEFLEEMRGSDSLTPEQKQLLQDFLTRCDLVKFARAEPTIDELKSLLDSALRLVDETAPVAESTASGSGKEAAAA